MVTGCFNSGNITAEKNYAAGVVAYMGNANCKTISCYNTGTIEGNADYTGGVVGRNVNTGSVSNCFNTGIVKANGNDRAADQISRRRAGGAFANTA